MVTNHLPGVATRLGTDYENAETLNPHTVYSEITGYIAPTSHVPANLDRTCSPKHTDQGIATERLAIINQRGKTVIVADHLMICQKRHGNRISGILLSVMDKLSLMVCETHH